MFFPENRALSIRYRSRSPLQRASRIPREPGFSGPPGVSVAVASAGIVAAEAHGRIIKSGMADIVARLPGGRSSLVTC